jgi:hypothetical protein
MFLVLDGLPENIALLQKSKIPACITPVDSSYIDVGLAPRSMLEPGQGTSVTLEFTKTGTDAIKYRARVVAGGPKALGTGVGPGIAKK